MSLLRKPIALLADILLSVAGGFYFGWQSFVYLRQQRRGRAC